MQPQREDSIIRVGNNVTQANYAQGDVRSRQYGYDPASGELNHMVVQKGRGVEVWNKVGDKQWVDQRGVRFNGDITVDQKTGQVSTCDMRGNCRTYNGRQWVNGGQRVDDGTETDNYGPDKNGGIRGGDRNGGTRGGDGQIREDGRRQPVESQADYDRRVEQTFGKPKCITDKDNYRENLFSAAENKKPVVMTFGSGSDPEFAKHCEAVKRAKDALGGKAEYMFVDLDKVDPNSAIGKYAIEHIAGRFGNPPTYTTGGFGTPLTMVFNQKQGEDPRRPVIPEKPTYWKKGTIDDEGRFASAIDAAYNEQLKRDIKTGRERRGEVDRPVPPPEQEQKPVTPKEVVNEALKPFDQQRPGELMKGLSREQQRDLMKEAIVQAKQIGDPVLRGRVHAMVAFTEIGWAEQAAKDGATQQAENHYVAAAQYLMVAGSFYPDLFKNSCADAMRKSSLPGETAEFLIQKGNEIPPGGTAPDGKWFERHQPEVRDNNARIQMINDMIKAEMKKPKRKAA